MEEREVRGLGADAGRGRRKQKPGSPGHPRGAGSYGAGVSTALVSGPFHTPQNYVGPRELLLSVGFFTILTTLKIKPERVVSFSVL